MNSDTPTAAAVTWLRNATLADGRRVDVSLRGPVIASVEPVGTAAPDGACEDLAGKLLLPAPAEPHAHLDKAYTAALVPNPKGDLLGAIEAWTGFLPDLTELSVKVQFPS